MARLYENIFHVQTTTAPSWLAIPFPSRSYLDRIRIATEATITLSLHSRLTEPDAFDIQDMYLNAAGNLCIVPAEPVVRYLRIGDILTVAGNSNAGNNSGGGVEHFVTSVADDGKFIVLNSTAGGTGSGGTGTVALTNGQKALYQLVGSTAVTGSADVTIAKAIPFVNQDTERPVRKWIDSVLHANVTATSGGWLQIAIAGSTDEV